MTQPSITLFTKPGCPYCDRAKTVLDQLRLTYEERNVKANRRNADESVSFSGIATVPQVFIGDYVINGAEDLAQLNQAQRLLPIVHAVENELPLDSVGDAVLARQAEDVLLRELIPQRDESRSNDPETWPILRFYQQFFGFWPNTFAYLSHWPAAYKLFVYCHNFSAVGLAKQALGDTNMYATAYATSNAHGCSYCQVYSAATGGDESLQVIQQLQQAKTGQADANNPFGPLEIALADLAAEAVRNQPDPILVPTLIKKIEVLSETPEKAQGYLTGVEMIVAAFGFLNVFNDLMGLEIEGDWAQQASKQTGIEAGRHGCASQNPNNLDYDLPTDGPSLKDMLAQYDAAVTDLSIYTHSELGLLPAWMQAWPQALVKRHAHFYCEVMGERGHTMLSSELKHLMARVSAIAKDHAYLAAVEGFMAHHAAADRDRAVARVQYCFAAATGRLPVGDLFSEREKAALQFAWLSAQTPLHTPRHFIQAALDHYSHQELVHLSTVCSMASMVQRFVVIAQPEVEPIVTEFLRQYSLESTPLALRYPMPVGQRRAIAI